MIKALKIALVDDHTLFRKGLLSLVNMVCPDAVVLFEADNGLQLQEKIPICGEPDILLLDVNMPGMDGFESVEWLSKFYPDIKVLVVSMIVSDESIIRLLTLGVNGYLSKDVEPSTLGEALRAVREKGYYYTDFITGKLVHSLQYEKHLRPQALPPMSDREMKFIQLACTEMTYSQIAAQMFLSPKTIDGYREALFEKLNVKSRVALAMVAVKYKWVTV